MHTLCTATRGLAEVAPGPRSPISPRSTTARRKFARPRAPRRHGLLLHVLRPAVPIYMGRDKYENEELIRYGWPEDLWFHVDKHSSARGPAAAARGDDRRRAAGDRPRVRAADEAQLIDGCKLNDADDRVHVVGQPAEDGRHGDGADRLPQEGRGALDGGTRARQRHRQPAQQDEGREAQQPGGALRAQAAARRRRARREQGGGERGAEGRGAREGRGAAGGVAGAARERERAAAAEEETEAAQALFANLAAGDVTFGGDDDAVYGASSDDDDGFGGGGGEAGLDTALDDLFGGGPRAARRGAAAASAAATARAAPRRRAAPPS